MVKRTARWRAGFYSALLAVFLIFALSGSYPAAQEETPPVSVTEEVTQPPVTEAPTLVPTDVPTEVPTEAPTEPPVVVEPPEVITEPPLEATEVVTEPPVESTEVVTEPPVEVTEGVIEPTEEITEVETEIPTEGTETTDLALPEESAPGIVGLSSDLSGLYTTWSVAPSQATAQGQVQGLEFQGNQVRVMVVMLDDASAQAAEANIASLGGVVIVRYRQWIDAWLPISALEQAAAIPNVSIIRSPVQVYPIPETTPLGDTTAQSSLPPVALATAGTMSSNAPADTGVTATAQSATIDSITRDRCVLTTVFTVGDPGLYYFQIWDDGAKIYERAYNARRNQRIVQRYTITEPVGQGAAGYGILIRSSTGTTLAIEDPYDIPTDAYLYCANGYVTRGVVASGANTWHQQGFLGSGVKVAILDSFADYTVAQSRGELPPNITTYGTLNLSSRHGTAVAEIIFDMAPGADLTFASPSNVVQMASYIEALALAGNKVISSSMGFYNAESGDGTGPIDDAIETARSYGAVYVQAAGNQATYNWQGNYRDTDSDGFHEFTSNGVEVNMLNRGGQVPAGWPILLFLRWNDWPSTGQDYNLYLYWWNGSTWEAVAGSTTVQSGSQPPVEQIYYTIPVTGYYGIVVHSSEPNNNYVLDLMGHNAPDFQYNLTDRSLVDPATPAEAVGVAAIDARSYRLESYSSRGPTLGPGGSLSAGLNQPRIAGYANVDTWSYNDYGVLFNGTSAATPHVAGAAALVFSAYPSFSPVQVISYLETNARDMGARGYDYIYGMGRLWLGASPRLLTPTPLSPPRDTNDNTPTFSWTSVDYADTYELQVAADSRFNNLLLNLTGIDTTSITPATFADGRYFWRVRAVNSGGLQGSWTRAQSFTVDTTPPDQTILRAPRDESGTRNTRPTFSWLGTRTANLYRLQVATDSAFSSVIVDEQTNRTSHRMSSDLSQGRYYWRVAARDAAGNWGAWSEEWSFDITLMRSPANGSYTTDTTPTFRWYTSRGAVGYELQVSTNTSFSNLVVDQTFGSRSAAFVAPLLDYDVYYWRVNVDFGSGMEISPIYWEVTVTPRPLPAPRLVSPANNTLTPFDEVPLEWQEVDDGANPVAYEVEVSRYSNFRIIEYSNITSSTTDVTDSLPDGVYYWRVRTLNYLGVGSRWSARWRFTIDTSAPDAPTLRSPADGAQVANTRTPFTWFAVPGAVRYEVQLGTSNPPSDTVQIGAGRSYRPTSPLLFTDYYWRVRAIDAAGNVSAWSSVFTVEIVSPANDRPVLNRYTTGSPTLTWSSITWAAGYEIQIDNAANFRSPEYSSGLIAGLSQTIPTTLPDGTWYWRVRAVDDTGRPGRWTSAGTFTVESE